MFDVEKSPSPFELDQPSPGYLDNSQLKQGIKALKDYVKKSKALKLSCSQRRNLLEAGQDDTTGMNKVIVEVVFKNIPDNSRTYIHKIVLPHHWRFRMMPEDSNMALFVRHRRPETEAQKIQFSRDRELDIDNTHSYYKDLFEEKLDGDIRSRISRIITTKELATEFNTFKKLDQLSKAYEFFLSDKQLMANKMNPVPRRLGRRFWVREKKVPIMVKLNSKNLNQCMHKALSNEPFYVRGISSTEKLQVGILSQTDQEILENLRVFLDKLFSLYRENVRFIKLKTSWGLALPLYADLSSSCPKRTIPKRKSKQKPIVDEFDMLPGGSKVSVSADGTVKVIKNHSTKRKAADQVGEADRSSKRLKKSSR